MRKVAKNSEKGTMKRSRPALNPEARENQLIALAVDLAEQQLIAGTASSQVITHYLKLGSSKEKLEREKLEEENKLLRAKTEKIQSDKKSDTFYQEVLKQFKIYSGTSDDEEDYFDD